MGGARLSVDAHVPCECALRPAKVVAERVGFEPTGPVRDRRFSRPEHSTALPPLRPVRIARRLVQPQFPVQPRGSGRYFPRPKGVFMDFWHGFAVLTAVHLLAAASPGPDFAYVTRQSLVSGRRAG